MTGKQLHILFVASWYPNRNHPVLGNFIQRHAQAISSKHKINVVAAFSSDGYTGKDEFHSGNLSEHIMLYPKIKEGDKILSTIRKVKAYRNAIHDGIQKCISRNGKPDIIHVHVAWPAALAVLPIARELNCPIVLSEHWSGYLPEDGNYKGYFLKRYTRNIVSKAKAITVVSEKMKAAMVHHGLSGDFYRLPNAVDTSVFRNAEIHKSDRVFRFLHVSMLVDREKNITGMLKAFAEANRNGQFELTIVGDGPERLKHEAMAKDLGLSGSVHFAGLRTPEEIAKLMNIHDALLMFSNFEGMPVTIIEAQCCGMTVLATNTGAIREMLTNPKDIIVTPGETTELANAMQLMRNELSDVRDIGSLRKNISIHAQEQYSYHAVAQVLDSIYKSVLT